MADIIDIFNITQHDRQPYYTAKVIDTNGDAVDITGATIYCNMVLKGASTLKINRSTSIVIRNQTTDTGIFDFQWGATDTNTIGTYYIEFEIVPSGGSGKFTIPAYEGDRKVTWIVKVRAGLDAQ